MLLLIVPQVDTLISKQHSANTEEKISLINIRYTRKIHPVVFADRFELKKFHKEVVQSSWLENTAFFRQMLKVY